MAPHENLFFVEKHYNDSLHKPQRAGTSHTDKEIQAAANLLGRDSVAVEDRHIKKTVRKKQDRARVERIRADGEALGDGIVMLGATATAVNASTSDGGADGEDGKLAFTTTTTTSNNIDDDDDPEHLLPMDGFGKRPKSKQQRERERNRGVRSAGWMIVARSSHVL